MGPHTQRAVPLRHLPAVLALLCALPLASAGDDSQRLASMSESELDAGMKSGVQVVSEDQHSQVKTVIARVSRPRDRVDRRKFNFSVSIGARIPRSVQVATLPDEIVQIVPQYRGFNYFVISYRTKDVGGGDYMLVWDQLVIIDPQTLEIVAIIPV